MEKLLCSMVTLDYRKKRTDGPGSFVDVGVKIESMFKNVKPFILNIYTHHTLNICYVINYDRENSLSNTKNGCGLE